MTVLKMFLFATAIVTVVALPAYEESAFIE